MLDIFADKCAWISFAEQHNAAATPNAVPMNGSQSYTLVAIHMAGGIPIPKSVLLDTRRAHGKFIADHFSGLRRLYECGEASSPWLPDILMRCREFAAIHNVDYNEVVCRLVEDTEKSRRRTRHEGPLKTHKTSGTPEEGISAQPVGGSDPSDIKI